MFFNSIDFAIFLPIVFLLYWFITNRNLNLQNFLIVIASYLFYGWWDWRFLSLIIFSTVVDFLIGIALSNEEKKVKRKALLLCSIIVNIGFLGVFKYYNFFVDSFVSAFSHLGLELQPNTLEIILPVGISFYTFQTLSYTIDVHNKKLKSTNNFLAFSAFVCFFPQLVAGPIERASNLLPQFQSKRIFNYGKAIDGCRQILWGLFKKIVIADNCAKFSNLIFTNSNDYSGGILALGAFLFAIQIYGDFSGYSDIAIGASRLFGIDLMRNFAFPYFSRDIAEFWRRWHISLSSWFKDYLYIPLGGNQGSMFMIIRNTFIVFIVSGFWHGANWVFIVWGALNALFFLPLMLTKRNKKYIDIVAKGKNWPTINEFLNISITFCMVSFAWIIFRADNINHAFQYIQDLFGGLVNMSSYIQTYNFIYWEVGFSIPILIITFFILEWIGRERQYAIEFIGDKWKKPYRFIFYYLIILSIFWFGGNEQQFIYFQF